jgi:hypothetical protein
MGTSNRYMVGAGLLPKKDLMTIAEKGGRRTPAIFCENFARMGLRDPLVSS